MDNLDVYKSWKEETLFGIQQKEEIPEKEPSVQNEEIIDESSEHDTEEEEFCYGLMDKYNDKV